MTVEERKKYIQDKINETRSDIVILLLNLSELEDILKDIKTENDFKKLEHFDLEKGLEIIEIMG